MQKNKIKKVGLIALSSVLMVASPVVLTGCMGGSGTASSDSNSNIIQVTQTSYKIEKNAVNDMCNGALKLTVTDMQRRPTSVFAGSDISTSQNMSGTSDSQVSAASTTDIAIQVDISYTWNVNTYTQAVTAAGGQVGSAPKTLEDLLQPGTFMYVQGVDADGNTYQTADVITPSSEDDVNALAINSQWDYDLLKSALPETSVTKNGSFLFRVASTARDLELIIITPTSGQSITSGNADDVMKGDVVKYSLPLT